MPAYKDKDRGTWYVKYQSRDPLTGQRKQVLKRGFRTRRDALDYEAKQRHTDAPSMITFGELAEKYFDYRDASLRTRSKQERSLQTVSFYDWRISDISKAVLMDWYMELSRSDMKNSSKNIRLTLVKSVFKYGQEFYDLPNPSVSLKRFKNDVKEMQVWTPEEFNQFISVIPHTRYVLLFTFMYWTGVRKAEAYNLRYDDFEGNRVHIRGTKTAGSDRWITIPDALRARLEPIFEVCSEDEPFIFGGENPLSETTPDGIFKRYTKIAGVKPIRIHDLRHSFASNAIASGANILAVSKYLGHSSPNLTMRTYAHLLEKTETDLVDRLEKLM